MQGYVLRRVLLVGVSLLGVAVLIFFLARSIPGDVAILYHGDSYEPDLAPFIREQLGLDQPAHRQFFLWLQSVVTGEWKSFYTGRPVSEEIWGRVPVSAELGLLGLLIALLIAFPLGTISAIRPHPLVDHPVRVLAVIGLAIPHFWLGLLLILFLFTAFQWVPPIIYSPVTEDVGENLKQMVFPALVLGFSNSAAIMRVLRASLLEVLRSDYIRTAWAKGLKERAIVVRHSFKNAMMPTLTVIGLELGSLISGVVIVETIFVVPGLGRFIVQSILQRDYPQIQANIIFVCTIYLFVNLFIDIAYALVDPRIHYR
ncbi:MAG: ABC transporter permease [Chloroflexi bacterium]|nr:ABC transporter permease [Chloroflexota bacterium]